MKKCPRCGLEKPPELFSKSWCKQCHSDSRMERYWEKRDEELEYKGTRRKEIRRENHGLLIEYYLLHPCIDCGENDPIVLEFDHVAGEKEFNVSEKLWKYRWDRILPEIEKCEVRCANCHRRKTAARGEWYTHF